MSDRQNTSADLAACHAMLCAGSRSFLAASRLLPRRVAEPAAALYAFCRMADDAIDERGDSVATLRARLARVYAGEPLALPPDRAMAAVVARHAIPPALPEALLDGFAWDAEGRRYDDLAGLADYAARVAGSVGAMMALLMGARSPAALARACELGVAMQFSNIARDVGEDARAGRLYLPRDWLREAGIDPEAFLRRPVFTPALGGVVARLLGEAATLYRRATPGIALLPRGCRPGIGAARLLYAEIGHAVARQGFDSVGRRATVPAGRKLVLLMRSLAAAAVPGAAAATPPLPAIRFLVDAAAPIRPTAALAASDGAGSARSVDERIAWLVDLFTRLGDRTQMES
jgi:phytoene synthase